MRHTLILLMAALISLGLYSCGDDGNSNQDAGSDTDTDTDADTDTDTDTDADTDTDTDTDVDAGLDGSIDPYIDIVVYTFDDGVTTFTAAPTYLATGVASTDMDTADSSYTDFVGNPGRAISDTGWASTSTPNYFTFTVTPPAGGSITLDEFLFDDRRSGTGPTDWGLVLDYGSGLVAAGTGTTHAAFTASPMNSVDLSALAGPHTSAVTFFLGASGASGPGGTWRVDNIAVRGVVTP